MVINLSLFVLDHSENYEFHCVDDSSISYILVCSAICIRHTVILLITTQNAKSHSRWTTLILFQSLGMPVFQITGTARHRNRISMTITFESFYREVVTLGLY